MGDTSAGVREHQDAVSLAVHPETLVLESAAGLLDLFFDGPAPRIMDLEREERQAPGRLQLFRPDPLGDGLQRRERDEPPPGQRTPLHILRETNALPHAVARLTARIACAILHILRKEVASP